MNPPLKGKSSFCSVEEDDGGRDTSLFPEKEYEGARWTHSSNFSVTAATGDLFHSSQVALGLEGLRMGGVS